jgi:hypothetical protein
MIKTRAKAVAFITHLEITEYYSTSRAWITKSARKRMPRWQLTCTISAVDWKSELARAVDQEDEEALRRAALAGAAKTIRFLSSRLPAADDDTKCKAVRSLGVVVGERNAVSDDRARELLRRLFWSLNDESGTVPFGVPEAIGEVLAVRTELQPEFLPLLCSLTHHPERVQTGRIERGIFWALGRLGQASARCSPEAVKSVMWAAHEHSDPESRRIAAWALSQFGEP